MADILPSITEVNVMTAFRTLLLTVVGCEVVRTQANRVPMPAGDFIALTSSSSSPISTNVDKYGSATKTIEQPTQFTIQIDSYGALANERAKTIAMVLRDDYACQQLAASGFDIQPLYASEAQQMPLVTGEEQYLSRWTLQAVLQYNPVVTVGQQFATALTPALIDVDVVYPP